MIYYVVKGLGRSAMNLVLTGWGKRLAERLRVLDYDWLFRQRRLPVGTYVFTGIERLSLAEREKAAAAWRALEEAEPAARLLNHPLLSMGRYELLRTLYELGLNPFDVYRLTEARAPQRFPVFLRRELDHAGPRSPLLPDRAALEAAVDELVATGECRDRLLMTEFADTRTEDGLYRKYGAFFIRTGDGGLVIPRHVHTARQWMVKSGSREIEEAAVEVEREYVDTNPHAEQIRRTFDLGRIDFGRIDYALATDGGLVVFEVNLNPQLVKPGPAKDEIRTFLKKAFAERFIAALEAIDDPGPSGRTVPFRLEERPLWKRHLHVIEVVMAVMARLRLHRHQPAVYARLLALREKVDSSR